MPFDSGCAKSAVAEENITRFFLAGSATGAISTANSLSAQVPSGERPGPPEGSVGSVSNSSRNAVIRGNCEVQRNDAVPCGAEGCARIEPSSCVTYQCSAASPAYSTGRTVQCG